jgi:hypothetical protein
MNKVKPIRPDEVILKKQESIPDGIFEAFNELIVENFDGHSAVIKLEAVKNLARTKIPDIPTNTMFEKHWFDVEDIYRKEGWGVEFDKPGYNENYEPYFVFKKSFNNI